MIFETKCRTEPFIISGPEVGFELQRYYLLHMYALLLTHGAAYLSILAWLPRLHALGESEKAQATQYLHITKQYHFSTEIIDRRRPLRIPASRNRSRKRR